MNDLTTFEAQKILHDWRQVHIDNFQNLFSYKKTVLSTLFLLAKNISK